MKKKILVVDDEKDVVFVISISLIRAGYTTIVAYDGLEALELITNEKPDLVILDIMMPKLDGYSVKIKLKEYPETKNIPIIVMTGKGNIKEAIILKKDTTIAHYFEKPFDMSELINKVNDVFVL